MHNARGRRVRRKIGFWAPWSVMTIVVVATYIEASRLIRSRSSDRFTGAQGRALEMRIKILEQKFQSNQQD